jgi:hypothetical protein
MTDGPDEQFEFGSGEADLYLGKKVEVDGEVFDADQMMVRYYAGSHPDVLIFTKDGKRQVGRVVITMSLHSSSPAISASADFHFHVSPVNDEMAAQMLGIYDSFKLSTQKS